MPDASGRFRGSGWSRAREDGWERAFGDWGIADLMRSTGEVVGQVEVQFEVQFDVNGYIKPETARRLDK